MKNKRNEENNNEIFLKDADVMIGYFTALPQPKVFSLEITQNIYPKVQVH